MTAAAGVAFAKLEGLANDFVLIEVAGESDLPDHDTIRKWANRRTGIGFDQLLILLPGGDDASYRVRIFNADGSEAEQCGNGMRAIAAWLDHHQRLTPDLRLNTAAGPVTLNAAGDGRYQADLPGPTTLSAAELDLPDPTVPVAGAGWRLVSLGNPHLVIDWPHAPTDQDLLDAAAALDATPAWRNRVNLGLVHRRDPGHLDLRVFERGAGPTPACGSGACAAAAALIALAPESTGEPMEVRQPGGSLVIDLNAIPGRVRTTGPARVVYQGITA